MFTKHTLLQGAAILTAAGLVSRLMGFFFRIFLSHAFGEESVGLYQLIFPVYALCLSVSTAGLQTAVSRMTAEKVSQGQKEAAGNVLRIALCLTLILSLAEGRAAGHHLLRPAVRRCPQLHLRLQFRHTAHRGPCGKPAHRTDCPDPVRGPPFSVYKKYGACAVDQTCRGRNRSRRICLRRIFFENALCPQAPDCKPRGGHSSPECGSSLHPRLPQALRLRRERCIKYIWRPDRHGPPLYPFSLCHHKLRGDRAPARRQLSPGGRGPHRHGQTVKKSSGKLPFPRAVLLSFLPYFRESARHCPFSQQHSR